MARMPIPLADGREALIDEEDYERVSRHSWSAYETGRGGVYAHAAINGKTVSLHRFLMGEPPCQVDHWDGDGLNNCRGNLRTATPQQNQANSRMKRSNTSGVKGVHWAKANRKWVAQIKVNYRSIHLGTFDVIEDAAAAYEEAARRYFGDFARPDRAA